MKKPSFQNGTFKLMVCSDIHEHLPIDPRTIRALQELLDAEKPDMVLFNGDVVGGRMDSAQSLREYITQLTAPLTERQIPWCHTYGNHDDEFIENPDLPKEVQQEIYESFPLCVSSRGPEDIPGVGNYKVELLSSDRTSPAFVVWGLDSHTYMYKNPPFAGENGARYKYPDNPWDNTDYDYIKFEQIAWYYHMSQDLEQRWGRKIPGLMFFHMALPEHRLVEWNPDETGKIGRQHDPVSNSPVNSGLFAALLQRGDVKGVFVGHDHVNDFVGTVSGIQLGFDASLGFSAYGLSGDDHAMRGARFFVMDEEDPANYKTYMRYAREFGVE